MIFPHGQSPWFRAVGGRCALDLNQLLEPMSRTAAVQILEQAGFVPLAIDPVSVARSRIRRSRYRRGARLSQAPLVVDCSSFTKWAFAQCGIWLPRRSIQQRGTGREVPLDAQRAADLVFTSGPRNYYLPGLPQGVGHVGIATGTGSIVHAATPSLGVREVAIDQFTNHGRIFRGAVRIIPAEADLITLATPSQWEIESEDDLRWLIAIRSVCAVA